MAKSKFEFGKVINNFDQVKRTLPPVLANQAQNFFVEGFRKQGFTDRSFKQWEQVKRRIPGTFEYKYPKKKQLSRRTSPILVRTGKLKRAVANSIRSQTFDRVQLIVSVPYAEYHNEGTDKIPQRRIMGDSFVLRSMQVKKITTFVGQIFK